MLCLCIFVVLLILFTAYYIYRLQNQNPRFYVETYTNDIASRISNAIRKIVEHSSQTSEAEIFNRNKIYTICDPNFRLYMVQKTLVDEDATVDVPIYKTSLDVLYIHDHNLFSNQEAINANFTLTPDTKKEEIPTTLETSYVYVGRYYITTIGTSTQPKKTLSFNQQMELVFIANDGKQSELYMPIKFKVSSAGNNLYIFNVYGTNLNLAIDSYNHLAYTTEDVAYLKIEEVQTLHNAVRTACYIPASSSDTRFQYKIERKTGTNHLFTPENCALIAQNLGKKTYAIEKMNHEGVGECVLPFEDKPYVFNGPDATDAYGDFAAGNSYCVPGDPNVVHVYDSQIQNYSGAEKLDDRSVPSYNNLRIVVKPILETKKKCEGEPLSKSECLEKYKDQCKYEGENEALFNDNTIKHLYCGAGSQSRCTMMCSTKDISELGKVIIQSQNLQGDETKFKCVGHPSSGSRDLRIIDCSNSDGTINPQALWITEFFDKDGKQGMRINQNASSKYLNHAICRNCNNEAIAYNKEDGENAVFYMGGQILYDFRTGKRDGGGEGNWCLYRHTGERNQNVHFDSTWCDSNNQGQQRFHIIKV